MKKGVRKPPRPPWRAKEQPEHHQRTKHIERRHFYVREAVEKMEIRVPYVATCDNIADFFTKPLAPKQYFAMRNLIMNYTPSHT